jgi:hypothetical protein
MFWSNDVKFILCNLQLKIINYFFFLSGMHYQSGLIFALNEHKHSRDKVIDNRGASMYWCLNLCVIFQ